MTKTAIGRRLIMHGDGVYSIKANCPCSIPFYMYQDNSNHITFIPLDICLSRLTTSLRHVTWSGFVALFFALGGIDTCHLEVIASILVENCCHAWGLFTPVPRKLLSHLRSVHTGPENTAVTPEVCSHRSREYCCHAWGLFTPVPRILLSRLRSVHTGPENTAVTPEVCSHRSRYK